MPAFPAIRRFGATSILTAVLLAGALLTTACGSDSVTGAPGPQPSQARVAITLSAADPFEGDVVTATAVVYDQRGVPVAGAPVAWSVSDTLLGELGAGGVITMLRPGTVRVIATSGALTQSTPVTVRALAVQSVTINPGMTVLQLQRGDITPIGVRVQGQGGRDVLGRAVQLRTDDPAVAVVDPSGRVRAVGPGITMVRATAEGVTGALRVEVLAADAVLSLTHAGQTRLPMLVSADSVMWDGVREYHEVYLETGELTLRGGVQPRYEITARYVEYDVRTVNGRRQMLIRTRQQEFDRGIVQYDARGDLLMTSEYIWPLAHTASVQSRGILVAFRVPGDDEVLQLFYRREPL